MAQDSGRRRNSFKVALNLLDDLMTGGQPSELSADLHQIASTTSDAGLLGNNLAEGHDIARSMAASNDDAAVSGLPASNRASPASPTFSSEDGDGALSNGTEPDRRRHIRARAEVDSTDTRVGAAAGSLYRDIRPGAEIKSSMRSLDAAENVNSTKQSWSFQPEILKASSTDNLRRASDPYKQSVPITIRQPVSVPATDNLVCGPAAYPARASAHPSGAPSKTGRSLGDESPPAASHGVSLNKLLPPAVRAASGGFEDTGTREDVNGTTAEIEEAVFHTEIPPNSPERADAANQQPSLMDDIRHDGLFSGSMHWVKDHIPEHAKKPAEVPASARANKPAEVHSTLPRLEAPRSELDRVLSPRRRALDQRTEFFQGGAGSGARAPGREEAQQAAAAPRAEIPVNAEDGKEISLLERQADEEEAHAHELERLLEAQAAELEHLRAAAAPVQSHQQQVDMRPASHESPVEENFAGLPTVELAMLGSSKREPLDCAKVLRHTFANCDASLLDAAAQRSAETAMRAGALGEREDPADALWAEVLAQQGQHLAELLRESRSLRAQAELRARLARCSSKGTADRLDLHELRSRIGLQKQLTSSLLESSAEQSLGQGSGMRQPTACGYAAGYAHGLKQCDVEEALVRFRSSSSHASLMHILESRLGRSEEVERIPATLATLLQDDVAASAEALLLECARLEMVAGLRRSGTAPGTPCGAAARTAAAVEDHFTAQIRRTGALCQGLAEEASALRSGTLSARSELSSQRSMPM